MTRYSVASRGGPKKPASQTPEIWRGIGCILILLVPLMSWVFATWTLKFMVNQGWPLPYQLMGFAQFPADLWRLPGLYPILAFLAGQPNLYMMLALTLAWIIVLSGLLSMGYAIIYRFVGPPRYGPLDLPEPQVKVGRYKR